MSAQGPLPARQLIYTNVEAEFSPTRQRGFQIWQWSPGLSAEQRRLIAQRVDNYRLPPGVVSTAPDVARHVFDRVNGLTVLARSVPLQEKDKFNRGGRFFAHAIVLDDSGFDAIGCDPFRVFDGGFAFLEHPNQVFASNDNWRKGELPDAEFVPNEPCADRTEIGRDVVLALLQHLETPGPLPIVVAEPPAGVLRLLRGLFALLPPEVRRKLTFDTLSGGASLQKLWFAVAGAYSPAALKLWSFRRYIRFEPASRLFIPEFSPAPLCLPQSLLFEPGWGALADNDRAALFDEGRKLVNHALADLRPDLLSAAALEVLENCKEGAEAIHSAEQLRLDDVPDAFAGLAAVRTNVAQYLRGPLAQRLTRLAVPVPHDTIRDALLKEFGCENGTPRRPTADQLCALMDWAKKQREPYLGAIADRWLGNFSLSSVAPRLATRNELLERFRKWARSTIDPSLLGPEGPNLIATSLQSGAVRPEALTEYKLCLALDRTLEYEAWRRAALLVASYSGEAIGPLIEQFGGAPPELRDWARGVALARLETAWAPGWVFRPLEQRFLFGLFFPAGHAAVPFIEVFKSSGRGKTAQMFFEGLCGETLFRESRDAPPARIDDGILEPQKDTKKHFQKVLYSGPESRNIAVNGLRKYLLSATDDEYRWAANETLGRFGAEWVWEAHESLSFVGLSVPVPNQAGNIIELFQAVAGATITEVGAGEAGLAQGGIPAVQRRRFLWAVNRLAYEFATRRLKI